MRAVIRGAGEENETMPTVMAVVAGLLAATIWGGFPVVTRMGVMHSLDPYDITAIRYTVAGLLLLPVFVRHRLEGIGWHGALLLMAGAGAPYMLLAAGGLTRTPAAHFGVITPSCMLVFAVFGAWLLLREQPDRARLTGVAGIVAGIALIAWEALLAAGSGLMTGDLMYVLAGLFWAVYTLACRYWRLQPLHAIAIVSVLSMLLYVPVYLFFAGPRLLQAPVSEVLMQGVFQGVLSGVLALLFYTRAVAVLGASRGAVFAAMVPASALLMAIPTLGESPSRLQWMGVALVTMSMLLALGLWRRAPRAQGAE